MSSVDWPTSLFCPCEDWEICCGSMCCPCFEYGSIKEALGDGYWGGCCLYCACNLCACIFHTETRHAIRTKYGVDGSTCFDCMAVTCCGCCALSQEAFLLKQKGAMTSLTSGKRGDGPKRQKMAERHYAAAH